MNIIYISHKKNSDLCFNFFYVIIKFEQAICNINNLGITMIIKYQII